MDLQIRTTDDGSSTLFSETFKECYHSTAGAATESLHVFIEAGLNALDKKHINIFEVGFGTGLNALLTALEVKEDDRCIEYTTIELYPLAIEIVDELILEMFLKIDHAIFQKLHQCAWNQRVEITPNFFLTKIQGNLLTSPITGTYDLVYFDAFSPSVQPELWTEGVFEKMYSRMKDGSLLTTYCAKGSVRRAMQKAGFMVERLPGPPPKREMLRASKLIIP